MVEIEELRELWCFLNSMLMSWGARVVVIFGVVYAVGIYRRSVNNWELSLSDLVSP